MGVCAERNAGEMRNSTREKHMIGLMTLNLDVVVGFGKGTWYGLSRSNIPRVEMGGIEPPSKEKTLKTSTYVALSFNFAPAHRTGTAHRRYLSYSRPSRASPAATENNDRLSHL
jgi:hypothetical protein